MRINVAIPEAHVDKPILDAALESVTRLDEAMLARGEIPPIEHAIARGVRWRPEPPGQEHFDHGGVVLKRGWGDCDDLAPWKAATLRHSGEDPGAIAIVTRSGPKRWHAIVQRSDGSIDDPSRDAGMGRPEGNRGAWLPSMPRPADVSGAYIVRPQLAIRPVRGGFQGRADLPWHWREHLADKPTPTDIAMVTLHSAPLAATALTGAIDGVCRLGAEAGFADDEHLERLSAVADCCNGMGYDELQHIYGDEHADAAWHLVGSLFGSLARAVSSVVSPVAKVVTSAAKAVPSFATSIVRSVANAPAFISHFASDPRGAVMQLAHDLGSIKIGPIPLGVTNLIWLADEAARRGLGQQLYSTLSSLAPSVIPGGAVLAQATHFLHDLSQANPALQSAIRSGVSHIPEIAHTVPVLVAKARAQAPKRLPTLAQMTPVARDAALRTYARTRRVPPHFHRGLAAFFA